MADSDETCSLTVKANGLVELQGGSDKHKYTSRLLDDRRTQTVVDRLDRLAKVHPGVCEREDLQLLGDILFNTLFGQAVCEVYETDDQQVLTRELKGETLRDAFFRIHEKSKQLLRLRLVFEQGADKWANLPWEFLYASRADDQGFFCLSVTRIIEPPVERKEPANPSLMLLILAEPRELSFTCESFDKLQERLRNLLSLSPDRLEPMNKPTWDMLAERLADNDKPVPDIIHFIGHGRFFNGQSQIALHRSKQDMDAERGINPQVNPAEADWRNVQDLAAQLTKRAPWLFFLQTCSSGRPDPGFGAFRSAAQQIAQAEVPFVVAMQYEIAAEDAQKFADAFYRALGAEASVDEAVKGGREALAKLSPVYGHPRFATPVVYLRSESRFLPRPRNLASTSQADATAGSLWPQRCPACPQLLYDKRKWCRCDKRTPLVYCRAGHANTSKDRECAMHNCSAPLEGMVAESAAPQRRRQP
jgi:CHAT domain-containing protein